LTYNILRQILWFSTIELVSDVKEDKVKEEGFYALTSS
jgi:hypothetical protein